MDPGETVDLTSTLVNIGGADLTNLATTIECFDPVITITDNSGVFGSLPVNTVMENTGDPYVISASASAINGHSADFTIISTADGGFVDTSYFRLCIGQDAPTDTGCYYAYYSGGPHVHCPQVDWVAIDTTQTTYVGTSLNLFDNQTVVVNLPFTFTYYAIDYNRISICSNGWIAMDSTNNVDWSNSGIPAPDGPAAMIAPYWADLDPGNSGASSDIYYYYDQPNNRFIIEYFQVEHWPSGSPETFEVILYDPLYYPTPTGDGEILFQYQVELQNTNGTVGIENSAENVGIEYFYDNNYHEWAAPITSCFAIRFTTYDPGQPGVNEYDEPTVANGQISLNVSPNPFHNTTNIRYSILDAGYSMQNPAVRVYNAAGRLVKSFDLESTIENPESAVVWDGRDEHNRILPNGIYFARLEADNLSAAAKIILVQ